MDYTKLGEHINITCVPEQREIAIKESKGRIQEILWQLPEEIRVDIMEEVEYIINMK